tara:strand:- start:8820 stop:8948 length:129 start_codon:yes stop_codon:yes gene_type:complete
MNISVLDIEQFKRFFQLIEKYKDELPVELKQEIQILIKALEG